MPGHRAAAWPDAPGRARRDQDRRLQLRGHALRDRGSLLPRRRPAGRGGVRPGGLYRRVPPSRPPLRPQPRQAEDPPSFQAGANVPDSHRGRHRHPGGLNMATPEAVAEKRDLAGINSDYKEKFGFHDSESGYAYKAPKGLSREIVESISEYKDEPQWMRDFRLKALEHFYSRPTPKWGGNLDQIDWDDIHYFVRASEKNSRDWSEVPDDIKNTFDRLGIPEAERKFLSGVGAQYESEVVYHQVNEKLEAQGVIFTDMDTALREHEDLLREYFATIIPPNDNKLAALNSAVWSGGSFVYVPAGVKVEMPLQAYFRINTENMGQFERTLIIAEEGADVHYIEGCTAPVYSSDSLHSAVVEIIAHPSARVRYTTVQNWSQNVFNLVTKRAIAYEKATMEWVDCNLGSKLTMKYPAIYLMGPEAQGRSSRSPSPAPASTRTRAARSSTPPRAPRPRSSPSRSPRTAAGRPTAA